MGEQKRCRQSVTSAETKSLVERVREVRVAAPVGIRIFSPAKGTTPPQTVCKNLTAKVERNGEVWNAIFEGDCGRPYRYTIKMEGRQVGKAVMFKGTVDLGPKDGGIFDWIGKASDKEFVGFFTSAGYTGTFFLTRPEAKEQKQ